MCYAVELFSLSKAKNFSFFSVSAGKGAVLMAILFARIPEKGILDFIARFSYSRVYGCLEGYGLNAYGD